MRYTYVWPQESHIHRCETCESSGATTKFELDEVYGAWWHHVAGVDNPGGDAPSRLATFKETPKLLNAKRCNSISEKAKQKIYAIDNTNRDTNEDFPLDWPRPVPVLFAIWQQIEIVIKMTSKWSKKKVILGCE